MTTSCMDIIMWNFLESQKNCAYPVNSLSNLKKFLLEKKALLIGTLPLQLMNGILPKIPEYDFIVKENTEMNEEWEHVESKDYYCWWFYTKSYTHKGTGVIIRLHHFMWDGQRKTLKDFFPILVMWDGKTWTTGEESWNLREIDFSLLYTELVLSTSILPQVYSLVNSGFSIKNLENIRNRILSMMNVNDSFSVMQCWEDLGKYPVGDWIQFFGKEKYVFTEGHFEPGRSSYNLFLMRNEKIFSEFVLKELRNLPPKVALESNPPKEILNCKECPPEPDALPITEDILSNSEDSEEKQYEEPLETETAEVDEWISVPPGISTSAPSTTAKIIRMNMEKTVKESLNTVEKILEKIKIVSEHGSYSLEIPYTGEQEIVEELLLLEYKLEIDSENGWMSISWRP